jgi:hypothetical protein
MLKQIKEFNTPKASPFILLAGCVVLLVFVIVLGVL